MKRLFTGLLLLLHLLWGYHAQSQCVFTPSNITVSGFGCFGPNGTYTPSGTLNGAPKWVSAYGPGNYRIVWTGSAWEIQYAIGAPFAFAANTTGSITNLPCSGGWNDPLDVDCIATVVTLSGGCGSLTPQTVAPSVSITANPGNSISTGTAVTFTATPVNGGTTPSYQWKKNGNDVGTNSSGYMDAGLADGDIITCVMTSSNPCASPASATSSAITMDVACYGALTVTSNDFDVAGTYAYVGQFNGAPKWAQTGGLYTVYWDAAASGWWLEYPDDPFFGGGFGYFNETGSISELPCTGWTAMTISEGCGPLPVAGVSATADPGNTITAGTSVTFTATPVNGGSMPHYQWKKNSINVGSDSNTYTDATLVDGDVIEVVLTSSAPCTAPVTSAAITISITSPCANVSGRIYVKPGGTGNGSSWANATGDLQAAIDNTCGATEVWVASGTYKPEHYPTGCTGCGTARDYAFMLKNGIKVYGGFAGTEASLSERVLGNESVLSGDIDNNNVLDNGNARHVLISVADGAETILDGFVITHGYGEQIAGQTDPSISIEGQLVYGSYAGGAVLFSSSAIFRNDYFNENHGHNGGGIFSAFGSNMMFENCHFSENTVNGGYGAAFYDYYSLGTLLDHCVLSGNSGLSGTQGTFYLYGFSAVIKNTQFLSNTVSSGGGIYNRGGLLVEDCTFENNMATNGGAVYFERLTTVNRCKFLGNTAQSLGGAIYCYNDCVLSNSVLANNTALSNDVNGAGGAVYLHSFDLEINNCTIADNKAPNGVGGGLVNYYGDIVTKNSILWNNTHLDPNPGSAHYFGYPSDAEFLISYSIVQGVTSGTGNQIVNPQFVNAAAGNYALSGCSPAINAGNNTGVMLTDITGATRIQNGTVDMGAYETVPATTFVTGVTLSNITETICHNTTCTDDDEFTADITVTYLSKPLTGSLQLSGSSILDASTALPQPVANLGETSFVFTGVKLHANGEALDLAASFDGGCSRNMDGSNIAPACVGPNEILVSGFNDPNDNGAYVPDGTYNGVPRWSNGVCELIFGGGTWTFKRLGSLPFVIGNNFSGTASQVPCANWYGIIYGTPIVNGSCDGHVTPLPCAVSNISLANISACNGNNTALGTDDFFTADITVSFAFAPAGKNLVLKRGNTIIATTQSDLSCVSTFTFEDISLPADGQAVVLTAEFADLEDGATCSFTSSALMTAPAACSSSTIGGRVLWEHLHVTANPIPVPDVTITMTGESTDTDITTASGTYVLSGSGDVFVTPSKNNNPRQGVDVADIARIRQHALGTLLFNDAYKVLAADVNENNSVTSSDATIVQQALLGSPSGAFYLDNPSWRFVAGGTTFSNPNTPWVFPTAIQVIDVNAPITGIDFIGVKMGDVNGTWNTAPVPTAPSATWSVANRPLETGTVVRIPFALSQTRTDVAAWQFMLRLDPAYITLNRVIPQSALPLTLGDFGVRHIEEGELRSVFAVAEGSPLKAGEIVFELELNVLQGGVFLSDVLSLDNSDILPARIYDTRLSGGQMKLAFTSAHESVVSTAAAIRKHNTFELYQNVPNPMNDETVIGFTLPTGSEATLTIYDATGKLITQVNGDYSAGFNAITLPRDLLGRTKGVLSYTLTAGEYSATRRLVILD